MDGDDDDDNGLCENKMDLCRVSKMYCCHASPAQVDIQMPDDFSNSSKDIPLEILIQQIGR